MKFYSMLNLALNEMARASKSEQFGKVKINTDIRATADKLTNINFYLLNQFNDETKAIIFNKIIDSLKDVTFETYDDLYNHVMIQTSKAIEEQGGKQNPTKLKYTTRVIFNTLGPSRLKVLEPSKYTEPVSTETGEQQPEEETVSGKYTINNNNFLDKALDKLYGFPPSILEPITQYFETHDGETLPDMKIRLGIQDEVKQYLEGRVDEDEQEILMKRLKRDNMAEVMIKLKGAEALQSTDKVKKKSSEEEMVPLLDVDEDDTGDVLSKDVERLTGGYGPRDRETDTGGIDFG